jgi:integrase
MQTQRNRRSYGTGSLLTYRGAWYGKWHVGARQVKRKVCAKRQPGSRDGLTRTQAERQLRRMMDETRVAPVGEHVSVRDAGERLLVHLEALGRKRSTLMGYESTLRVHLAAYFGDRALDGVDERDVEAFIAWMRVQGRSAKTTLNALGFLHSIFEHGQRRGWASSNPCKRAEKPRGDRDEEIRYLESAELEGVLRAVPVGALGRVEGAMYLTAATTGLRQGELLGLRWRDIDWPARRVRVRRSYVRGEFGTPKSKRSTRSVPLIDRTAGELDRLHQASAYQGDDDLVFGHPVLGGPLDRSRVLKRFKAALKRAGVRQARFHDLRHTFGTRMAARGVPMRALQEMMGHRDAKTTEVYADYAPSEHEADWAEAAFAGTNPGTNLSATESNSKHLEPR